MVTVGRVGSGVEIPLGDVLWGKRCWRVGLRVDGGDGKIRGREGRGQRGD